MNDTTKKRLRSFDKEDEEQIISWLRGEEVSLKKPLLKKLKEATQEEWDDTNKLIFILFFEHRDFADPSGFFIRISIDTMADGKLSEDDSKRVEWIQEILEYEVSEQSLEEHYVIRYTTEDEANSEDSWLAGKLYPHIIERFKVDLSRLPGLEVLKERAKKLCIPYENSEGDFGSWRSPEFDEYKKLLAPVS